MPGQIFISYSRKDSNFVSVIGTALIGEGYSVWFDQTALDVGDRWREEIVAGIRDCKAFVLVLSENSVDSTEVAKELSLAEEHKKAIFPLMWGETQISDRLAYQLAGLQFAQFRLGESEKGLKRLMDGLAKAGIRPEKRASDSLQSSCFGRDSQLSALEDAMSAAIDNRSAEVRFVTGTSGAGKTVLVEEFIQRAVDRYETLVAGFGRCSARTGPGDPYAPFKDVLTLLTGDLANRATAVGVCSKNAARLGDRAQATSTALLDHAPDLIGSVAPDIKDLVNRAERFGLDDELKARLAAHAAKFRNTADLTQERIQTQFVKLFEAFSSASPLLIVVDDLQWADVPSIALLFRLSRELMASPVLIVGTYRQNVVALERDGARHPLEGVCAEIRARSGDVTICLDAEDEAGGRAFVDALLDSEPNLLDDTFRRALVARTAGNALFVTELIQNLREQGDLALDDHGRWVASDVDWDTLPARTEAVLEERLARLSEDERDLLRTASVEGTEFTAEFIARLCEVDERKMIRALERDLGKRHGLVLTASVERRGERWMSHYRFVQSHLQRFLYQELAPRERMLFHRELAELLTEIYSDRLEEVASQLAWHFGCAGVPEQAVVHHMAAAHRALRLGGYEEAGHHLERGREFVSQLAEGLDRDRIELEIMIMHGTVLKARKGWVHPEVCAVYEHARQLGVRIGADDLVYPALFALWAIRLVRLELSEAQALAESCLAIAGSLDDADMGVQASVSLGNTLFWMGRLDDAATQFARALELFDPETAADHLVRHGQDSRVFALMFQGLIASIRGRPDEAIEREGEMLSLARSLQHPYTSAIALQGAAWTRLHLDQPSVAEVYANQLVDVAEEHGFPFYLGVGLLIRGWALAMRGDERGLAMLDEAFHEHLARDGGQLFHSLYCLSKARALLSAGLYEATKAIADKGLEVAHDREELLYAAWLMQLAAEASAHLAPAERDNALARLETARAAARAQGAGAVETQIDIAIARMGRAIT